MSKNQRKQKIKELISTHTLEEIAGKCGRDIRTIGRDIAEMKDSGEWYEWIEIEFIRLHGSIQEEDEALAYKEIAKLYGKTLISKSESKVEAKGEIVVKAYDLGNKR